MAIARRLAMGICALVGALGLVLAALMLFVQTFAPAPEPRTPAERRALNLRVFDKVWETVDRRYYDRTFHGVDWRRSREVWRPRAADAGSTDALYWLVLGNMLGELRDVHTQVNAPTTAPPERRPAAPGVLVTPSPTRPCPPLDILLGATAAQGWTGRVLDVRPGTPADAAGVQPGWTVSNVNVSVPANGCRWVSRVEVVDDGGRTQNVTADAPPAAAPFPQRFARTLPGGAHLLAFTEFANGAPHWLVGELAHAPAQGVVLDLRRNRGGEVWALKVVAGVLLGPGRPLGEAVTGSRIAAWRSAPLNWWRRFLLNDYALHDGSRFLGPLVVLIGPGSASAAETLADAVQHSRRGLLIGDRTAGTVLAAEHVRLPDGGTLSVSVSDYRDAEGRRLEGVGVTPDVPVRQTLAAIRAGRDLPLEAAEARLAGRR